MKPGNFCYFFGTFNPVHMGHFDMARNVYEKMHYEKIIFVPNFMPCHKNLKISPYDRLNMLKLLPTKGWAEISDIEFHLQTPSYTYRTVNALYSGKRLNFIVGYDAFIDIEKWKNPDELKEKLFFVVLQRHSDNVKKEDIEKLKNRGFSFEIASDIDYIDISSETIRKNVLENKSITGMVTKEVEKYIYEHGLYKKLA